MDIKKEIRRDTYAVKITAEEDGHIVGWAYLYIIVNDRHVEPYGLLENVYVVPEYRGKGIGRSLLDTAIAEAQERSCYKLIAQSRHGKESVHALYEKLGFRNHGLNFRMDLILGSAVRQVD